MRLVGADVVFLQEVLGAAPPPHGARGEKVTTPQYEFLADSIWQQYAYGRNAVYPNGHHGNAVLSKFPIVRTSNHDVSIAGPREARPAALRAATCPARAATARRSACTWAWPRRTASSSSTCCAS